VIPLTTAAYWTRVREPRALRSGADGAFRSDAGGAFRSGAGGAPTEAD